MESETQKQPPERIFFKLYLMQLNIVNPFHATGLF